MDEILNSIDVLEELSTRNTSLCRTLGGLRDYSNATNAALCRLGTLLPTIEDLRVRKYVFSVATELVDKCNEYIATVIAEDPDKDFNYPGIGFKSQVTILHKMESKETDFREVNLHISDSFEKITDTAIL